MTLALSYKTGLSMQPLSSPRIFYRNTRRDPNPFLITFPDHVHKLLIYPDYIKGV